MITRLSGTLERVEPTAVEVAVGPVVPIMPRGT